MGVNTVAVESAADMMHPLHRKKLVSALKELRGRGGKRFKGGVMLFGGGGDEEKQWGG